MDAQRRENILKEALDYILLILGGVIFAVALNVFLVPSQIVPSGFTGVATLLNHLFGLPIGAMIVVMNIPLYIIAFRVIGMKFTIKTFVATLVMSAAIDTLDFLPSITDDRLLCAIYGGIVAGVGFSMILYGGATSGGSDLLARLLMRLTTMPIGRLILIIDGIVILSSIPVYGNIDSALFSAIELYIDTRIIDAILTGVGSSKATYIITNRPAEISDKILHTMHRGVTKLNAVGMYTNREHSVLLVVVKTRETPKLKNIIKESDPDSFAIMVSASEVMGLGFKRYDAR